MNKWLLTTLSFCFCTVIQAKTFYLPTCKLAGQEVQIKAENPTQETSTIDLYIKRSTEKLPEVVRIRVEAGDRKFIKLHEYCDDHDVAWIKPDILNPDAVSMSLAWGKDFHPLETKLSNLWHSYVSVSDAILHTQNHSHLVNPVEIRAYDKQGKKLGIQKVELSPFESLELQLKKNTYRVELISKYRSLNFTYSQRGYFENSIAKLAENKKFKKDMTYFLVKHQSNKEAKSYVIALNNKEQIALARRSISEPHNENLPRIVMGKVRAEKDDYNTHVLSENNVNWSWELYDIEFSSLGSINCDTNPQLIEELLPKFIHSEQRLCPWNYRIVEELER